MDSEVKVVNRAGRTFIEMPDGKLIPTISGGRAEEPGTGGGAGAGSNNVEELLRKQQHQIEQLLQVVQSQRSDFDDLVGAIAEAVQEDEQGEDENEENAPEDQNQRFVNQRMNQNNDADNQQVLSMQREMQKMQKQMEAMQQMIIEREQAMEEERELRLASQRDTQLQQALQEAGVLPNAIENAVKLFRDDVAYDEENEEFVYIDPKSGLRLPILEGVKDNMPDYLKAPINPRGGSGGRGSQATAMLEQARTTLSKLELAAKKSGSDQDIAAYHAAKKEVLRMEGTSSKPPTVPGSTPNQPRVPKQSVPVNAIPDED